MSDRMTLGEVKFGSLTVRDKKYEHDVVVFPDGEVRPRAKERLVFGSHTIMKEEVEELVQAGATSVVVGKGIYSLAKLSQEAKAYLSENRVEVYELASPAAAKKFNELLQEGKKPAAIIHVTC